MKIELSTVDYDFFLKYFDCAIDSICNVEKKENTVVFEVDNKDLVSFEVEMSSDIIHNGMNNQNTVNEIGKRMYLIYDTIIDQK